MILMFAHEWHAMPHTGNSRNSGIACGFATVTSCNIQFVKGRLQPLVGKFWSLVSCLSQAAKARCAASAHCLRSNPRLFNHCHKLSCWFVLYHCCCSAVSASSLLPLKVLGVWNVFLGHSAVFCKLEGDQCGRQGTQYRCAQDLCDFNLCADCYQPGTECVQRLCSATS